MKRFKAYDPPEYHDWLPDPAVMREFREKLQASESRRSVLDEMGGEKHLTLYRGLVRNRLHDVQLKRWVRQGVISKAWLGTGEEAATIGAVHALRDSDVVGPMIRNAGACHEKGMSIVNLLRAYLGTKDSPGGGRDIHVGDLSCGVVAPISMVGSLVPVCAGLALSFKREGRARVALTWAGDGTTRTTAFHEGMMCARATNAPLIVVVQDNQIALGTTGDKHSRAPLSELGAVYATECITCDGNHVLDVYAATALAAEICRNGRGPVLMVAKTFRMGGHATHDEGESRSILAPELFEYWGKRDPIGMYETYLATAEVTLVEGMQNRLALLQVEAEVTQEIELAEKLALQSRDTDQPDPRTQREGVFQEQ